MASLLGQPGWHGGCRLPDPLAAPNSWQHREELPEGQAPRKPGKETGWSRRWSGEEHTGWASWHPAVLPALRTGLRMAQGTPPAAARLTQVPAQMLSLRVQPFGQRTWRCHLMRCHLMP